MNKQMDTQKADGSTALVWLIKKNKI